MPGQISAALLAAMTLTFNQAPETINETQDSIEQQSTNSDQARQERQMKLKKMNLEKRDREKSSEQQSPENITVTVDKNGNEIAGSPDSSGGGGTVFVTETETASPVPPEVANSAPADNENATVVSNQDSIPGVSAEDVARFDKIAECESGNNWSINTGNGFHGGLQFLPSTWTGFGGEKYAPYAYQATREQQIEIAGKVQKSQGWGAWPACTSKLGIS